MRTMKEMGFEAKPAVLPRHAPDPTGIRWVRGEIDIHQVSGFWCAYRRPSRTHRHMTYLNVPGGGARVFDTPEAAALAAIEAWGLC
jgi:hypothetical protein